MNRPADVNPQTWASIQQQTVKDFGPVWVCGCEARSKGIHLCQYHEGFDDALDVGRVGVSERQAVLDAATAWADATEAPMICSGSISSRQRADAALRAAVVAYRSTQIPEEDDGCV